jgi:hypothetical protein
MNVFDSQPAKVGMEVSSQVFDMFAVRRAKNYVIKASRVDLPRKRPMLAPALSIFSTALHQTTTTSSLPIEAPGPLKTASNDNRVSWA